MKTTLIGTSYGAPSITTSGIKIAKEISSDTADEQVGVQLAQDLATRVREECGDGVKLSLILFASLLQHGNALIQVGTNPLLLKSGIEKASHAAIHYIQKHAKKIAKQSEIEQIAHIASSGNTIVSHLITEAVKKAGKEGIITVEEGKSSDSFIETVEGMRLDRGMLSPHFADNTENLSRTLLQPRILVTDQKIHSIHDIIPVLQECAQTSKELLIIAEDIEKEALSTLVINYLRGTLKVVAIKAPGFGDRRKALTSDIALFTGAQFISEEFGRSLKEVSLSDLGTATRVEITKDKTTITGSHCDPQLLRERLALIDAEMDLVTSDYEREQLEQRKAKLTGGIHTIKVGGATEPELKDLKNTIDASLLTLRAAIADGVVPGGGTSLLHCCKAIDQLHLTGEEKMGADAFKKALSSSLNQLVINADEDPSIAKAALEKAGENSVFNIETRRVEDAFTCGIVDSVRLLTSVLSIVTSASGTALLTDVLITDAVEE